MVARDNNELENELAKFQETIEKYNKHLAERLKKGANTTTLIKAISHMNEEEAYYREMLTKDKGFIELTDSDENVPILVKASNIVGMKRYRDGVEYTCVDTSTVSYKVKETPEMVMLRISELNILALDYLKDITNDLTTTLDNLAKKYPELSLDENIPKLNIRVKGKEQNSHPFE
jgi:hypothetical protein